MISKCLLDNLKSVDGVDVCR